MTEPVTLGSKRLTHSEMAAEYHAMDAACRREQWIEAVRGEDDYTDSEREGQARMYDRLNTLYRFATLPHTTFQSFSGFLAVICLPLIYERRATRG